MRVRSSCGRGAAAGAGELAARPRDAGGAGGGPGRATQVTQTQLEWITDAYSLVFWPGVNGNP